MDNKTFETAKQHAVIDVPVAHPDDTVEQIINNIFGKRYSSASHIAVLEKGKLVGVLTAEDLFSSNKQVKIKEIMDPDPPKVSPDTDQEVAAWQATQKGEYSLAVVDEYSYFIGFIPPPTLLKILLQEHEEDLAIISGLYQSNEKVMVSSNLPVYKKAFKRLPWLMVGLVGSLLSAGIMNYFEKEIEKYVILTFFIPTVVYLADAVGTQTEAVIVRAVSLNITDKNLYLKETLTTVVIGMVLLVLSFTSISFIWNDYKIALIVSLAILFASSVAGFIASTLPLILNKTGIDPAYGSGPIATVIQDTISVFIYFLVSSTLT